MTDNSVLYITSLYGLIKKDFNLEEIRTLCFHLGVDYESLPGEGRQSKIREMLLVLARHKRIPQLVQMLQDERPFTTWPQVPPDFELPDSLMFGGEGSSKSTVFQGDQVQGDKIQNQEVQSQVEQDRRNTASGGDSINISGDIHGSPVIQINKSTLSKLGTVLAVISALGVLILVAQYAVEVTQTRVPVFPETDFVVAVSEFEVLGNSRTRDLEALAQTLSSEIDKGFNDLDEEIIFVSPSQINIKVEGDTPEERANHAAALADEMNIDVFVYGVITGNGWEADIEIEFIVSESYVELSEGEELVERPDFSVEGPYFPPFKIQLEKADNIESIATAKMTLESGFDALIVVARGLSEYTLSNYDEAEQQFREALEIVTSIPDWKSYDLIHVLLGNAIGQQCADQLYKSNNYEEAMTCFDRAKEQYEIAIGENNNYPRAYLGLASAYYMQGIGNPNVSSYEDVNTENLDKAIDNYSAALQEKENLPAANIEAKAYLGLGQAHLMKSIVALDDARPTLERFNEAERNFQRVVQICDQEDCAAGADFWIQEITAKSYANLGLIYYLVEDYETAESMYQDAIDLIPPFTTAQRRLKDIYEDRLDEIQQKIEEQESNLQANSRDNG